MPQTPQSEVPFGSQVGMGQALAWTPVGWTLEAMLEEAKAPVATRERAKRRAREEGRRQQQLYNGNSTNFEPRHDEEDEASG